MNAPERATIEHMIPGRIRLRFAARRGDTAFFQTLVPVLKAHPLVHRVKANPLTGSVLIEHSGREAKLARMELPIAIESPPLVPRHSPMQRLRARGGALRLGPGAAALSALGLYQAAHGRLLSSGGELFWHSLRLSGTKNLWVIGVLSGLGLLQSLRGRLLPPASSLFVYAMLLNEVYRAARRQPGTPG
jgi:Heavy metal associated domain 2